MPNQKIIIIDGNSLINRAFYALPPLMTKKGIHTNAVYGFNSMLNKIKKEYNPEYLVVTFDKKAPTFRHKEYVDYKAGRKKMPPELAQQIPLLKELLGVLNIDYVELEGFEADDLIGTIANISEENNIDSIIITGDKDALQLVSEYTKVVITKKGLSEFELYDNNAFVEKYGITPTQFIDLKGLMGDKSDNIPGIPGVGEKTGLKLLKEFKSIENLIENIDDISNSKLKQKIYENSQLALMSKKLATINVNVPIEIELEDYKLVSENIDKLVSMYKKLEFYSLIPKLINKSNPKEDDIKNIDKVYINSENDFVQLEEYMNKEEELYIKVFSTESHIDVDNIIGISILINNKYFYIDNISKLINVLKDVFDNTNIKIIGHNLKKDIFSLMQIGIRLKNIEFDTVIAQYLLEPTRSNYDLKELSMEYFNREIKDEKDFLADNSQLDLLKIETEKYSNYGLDWCITVNNLKKILERELEENNLKDLYNEIEMPLIEVLAEMEHNGFMVNQNILIEIGKNIENNINEIANNIYTMAGESFNINSPKQLGIILFERLNLTPIKKTKTGYSTSVDVLEKLMGKHDIIALIMKYRQLAKLKSTYIDGLIPLINTKTNKIHPHFNQTVTATGRISCTEPNLQNIPIKQEMGRKIRKAFVTSSNEYTLLTADYSQIELRVLAHVSKDENLINAFNNNEDIHKITASKVFDVPFDEVTTLQRSRAKAVNFGVIYGMSDFGLSENLKITRKEANTYINEYFNKYAQVKRYMDDIKEECKNNGYVTTIMNRKRYIPEIRSSNFNIRSLGERLAMNTPIHGSAADIIKIAMIKVYNRLKNNNLKSKIILQIHDELLIEVYKEELEEVKEIIKNEMENAYKLEVPLTVDMNIGDDWYSLK